MCFEQINSRKFEQAQRTLLFDFMNKCDLNAIATIAVDDKPEVAIMQFAVTERLEIIFDTLASTILPADNRMGFA